MDDLDRRQVMIMNNDLDWNRVLLSREVFVSFFSWELVAIVPILLSTRFGFLMYK
jgi:hypothetical protein